MEIKLNDSGLFALTYFKRIVDGEEFEGSTSPIKRPVAAVSAEKILETFKGVLENEKIVEAFRQLIGFSPQTWLEEMIKGKWFEKVGLSKPIHKKDLKIIREGLDIIITNLSPVKA